MACSCGFVPPSGCACGFADGDTITFEGVDGQPTQRRPSPIINPRTDNILTCTASGLFAEIPSRFRDPPSCRVYRSTTQTIFNNESNDIVFDTANFNTHGIWTGGSEFRTTVSGMYYMCFSSRFSANANGSRHARIFKDGDLIAQDGFEAITSKNYSVSVMVAWPLAANSGIKVDMFQDSGVDLTTTAANGTTNNQMCTFSMCFLGDI